MIVGFRKTRVPAERCIFVLAISRRRHSISVFVERVPFHMIIETFKPLRVGFHSDLDRSLHYDPARAAGMVGFAFPLDFFILGLE